MFKNSKYISLLYFYIILMSKKYSNIVKNYILGIFLKYLFLIFNIYKTLFLLTIYLYAGYPIHFYLIFDIKIKFLNIKGVQAYNFKICVEGEGQDTSRLF